LKGKPVDSQFLFLSNIIIPKIFIFKLHFCSLAQGFDSLSDFAEHLATNVDIVFPVIHGKFGEDGGIQVCSLPVKSGLQGKDIDSCLLILSFTWHCTSYSV
jgi:hypothetical protein